MSTIQAIMHFELLPNEIIIECFEYLNPVDIFHSFDQLNYHFYKLIRSIPLNLDTRTIPKLKLNQFCKKMLSNPEMKKQIYSLHLSNEHNYSQIFMFLSIFSLIEFSNLRSLTLREVKQYEVPQLKLMLPLLSQLSCFRLIDSDDKNNEILPILSISKIRTLTVSELFLNNTLIHDISSIINLTISSCNKNELLQILNNASKLEYLNVQNLFEDWVPLIKATKHSSKHHAIHLKQLVITNFPYGFCDLEMILKQTPNLKSLTIGSDDNKDVIDADKWQDLITSSLPYLNIFKFDFKFGYYWVTKDHTVPEKWTKFQGDFWHKLHHWYTEYSLSEYTSAIYTIPYISGSFQLRKDMTRYCNKLISNMNTFDNVTDLVIDHYAITEQCQYHFSNVTSLELGERSLFSDNSFLGEKDIESLKMIVNLSNVKDLKILSHCKFETPSLLLQILKQTPQLSSISVSTDCLTVLGDDDELCKYLNKTIKNLIISNFWQNSFNTLDEINQFCKIFPNLEQLSCRIEQLNSLLFLLKDLSKLSYIYASLSRSTSVHKLNWFKEEVHKLDETIIINIESNNNTIDSICIIRDIYQSYIIIHKKIKATALYF